jgi:hypothetical protein
MGGGGPWIIESQGGKRSSRLCTRLVVTPLILAGSEQRLEKPAEFVFISNLNMKAVCPPKLHVVKVQNTAIPGFRRNADEICALKRCYAASCGNQTYVKRHVNVSFPELGLLHPEDGTDTLSRNVGKQLLHDTA